MLTSNRSTLTQQSCRRAAKRFSCQAHFLCNKKILTTTQNVHLIEFSVSAYEIESVENFNQKSRKSADGDISSATLRQSIHNQHTSTIDVGKVNVRGVESRRSCLWMSCDVLYVFG